MLEDVADQCRGGGFAVGAGDADKLTLRHGAPQNFDIAENVDACSPRRDHCWMVERNAGAGHQGSDSAPFEAGAIVN